MRRQQKKKPTAQHAMTLQKQAFQNIKTPNFPKHRKKALFRNTNISKLLTGQKSGRKSRTAQNAIKLQKQAFQKIKTQNFAKCRKKAFFLTTNIFKLVHPNNPCTMWASKNPIFIRATPCQRGFAAKCPVHKFRCVFLQNWALGSGGGGEFVTFGLFCCCHIFPLKCLFL